MNLGILGSGHLGPHVDQKHELIETRTEEITDVKTEIRRYHTLEGPFFDEETTAGNRYRTLKWWRENKQKFHIVNKVTRRIHIIQIHPRSPKYIYAVLKKITRKESLIEIWYGLNTNRIDEYIDKS